MNLDLRKPKEPILMTPGGGLNVAETQIIVLMHQHVGELEQVAALC